jgi:hypothetical protein
VWGSWCLGLKSLLEVFARGLRMKSALWRAARIGH